MAIFAIPNPKKNIFVDYPLNKVKTGVKRISAINPKYKLHSSNEAFNQYTFESAEFLSLGIYADINLNSITEQKTEIVIEIRRKLGTFNESHEVTLANKHISNLIDYIAKGATLTDEEIEKIKEKRAEKKTYSKTTTLILFIFLGIWGVHRFYTKNYLFGILQLFTLCGFGIWWIVDLILILNNSYKDGNGNKLR